MARPGRKELKMSELAVGERAEVTAIGLSGGLRRRLQDMGLIPGTIIRCVLKSPGGGSKAFAIRGAVVAVRAEDARLVSVVGL